MRSNITSERDLICPVCGSRTRVLLNGLCVSCYLEKLLEKLPEELEVRICKSCGKYERSLEDMVSKHLKDSDIEIDCELEPLDEENLKITLKHDKYKKEKIVKLDYDFYLCHNCYLSTASFYEAIVQVRGKNWRYVSDVIKFLINNLEQKRNKKLVSEEKELKNGMDFRIMDKYVAEQIIKKIQNNYKLAYISKTTSKFKGIDKQTSKPKLKFTYLLRTYDYVRGDAIVYNNDLYVVDNIDKNTIILTNTRTGNKIKLSLNEVHKHGKKLEEEEGTLLYEENKLAYINTKDNNIIEALVLDDHPKPGEKVGFVNYDNKTYLVKRYGKKEK